MDIAAISMNLSQAKVAQQVGISVMKLAMNSMEGQSADLAKMLAGSVKIMEQSINPGLGASLDIYA